MRRRRAAAAAILSAALAAALPAQRPESLPFGSLRLPSRSFVLEYNPHNRGKSWLTDEGAVLVQVGDVRLTFGDVRLRADAVILWLAGAGPEGLPGLTTSRPADSRPSDDDFFRLPDLARRFVREVYVEGTIVFMQGDEVSRADAAYFDLERDRGVVLDARTSLPFETREGPSRLYVRADELRLLASDRFEAFGARATTCNFGHPHFHLGSEHLEMWRTRPHKRVRRFREDRRRPITGPQVGYSAQGNVLRLGESTVFWLPSVSGDTGSPGGGVLPRVRDIRAGRNSEFGIEAGVTVGDDITHDGEPWAEWGVLFDWRSKRGLGGGVDFAYEGDDFRGALLAYYQRDHGVDRLYGPPETKNRGRISFQHRHLLPWDVQLDAELNLFSDRRYYEVYFENDFKTEKPPETYLYAKKAFDRSALTALYLQRVNNWETTTEYAPSVDYTLLAEPLFDVADRPVYLTARAEASRVRREVDDDLDVPTRATNRFDLDTLLEYGFQAGPITVTPFAGLRTTWYEEDLFFRDDRLRDGVTYGVRLSTQAWKSYEADSGLFDIDGVRHVVRPSIEYRRTVGVDLRPADLVPYDGVDLFGDREEIAFELRNLFQTVRRDAEGPRVTEFLDLDFEISWFPDAERDNAGRPWGPLKGDHVVRFSDELQLLADFEWHPGENEMEVLNVAAGYAPYPELQLYAGYRSWAPQYDLVFGQVNWRVAEKWLLRAYGSYDFERKGAVEHEFGLVRIGHDFAFEVFFRFDFGEDDHSFNIALIPRGWFDPVVDPAKRLGHEPRLDQLDARIYR
ncbi:MAG TPA: LPS assembly protein LptD [Planctomycetota bacterium]|nr:LPS assembly protein LptD [Planctomycetota bacterium]